MRLESSIPPILLVVALSAALAFVRLVLGRTLPDRVVALDLISTAAVAILALASVSQGAPVLLDVAVVLALIAFIGTVAFARFIEREDRSD
jgi:multicomponent Na+:H+ antiporter subunit F